MAYDYHASSDDAGLRLGGLLLTSLLVHAAVVPWLVARALPDDLPPLPETRSIEAMELVTVRERPEQEPIQFVSLPEPPPDEARVPEDARFADQFDRAVEVETVSRRDIVQPRTEAPAASAVAARAAAARADSPPPRETEAADDEEQSPRERRRDRRRDREAPAESATEDRFVDDSGRSDDLMVPRRAEGSRGGDGRDGVDLSAFFRQPVGAPNPPDARRPDYIEVDEGERTALNSYRSMYWSFFDRMQQALYREWKPTEVLRRNDPTGTLYGNRDRYTVLAVTLNGDGSLRHARVERSSELEFLDQEAIRTFQAAAPFHNVPEGLKDHNGQAHFRYGFHVSFSSSARRIRRMD